MANPRQWIVPSVEDRKNALFIKPAIPEKELNPKTVATIQYGLLRGIEEVFQLEEGEILAEPMPSSDGRSGFLLYEAAEGGAGVLTRLVTDSQSLSQVALEALKIMHFDVDATKLPSSVEHLNDLGSQVCVAGCYKCLLSYFNQTDHELIDRRDSLAKSILLKMAKSKTQHQDCEVESAQLNIDPNWIVLLDQNKIPSIDRKPLSIEGTIIPVVWRSHYIVALFSDLPRHIEKQLEDKGFTLVRFSQDPTSWAAQIKTLAKCFEGASS